PFLAPGRKMMATARAWAAQGDGSGVCSGLAQAGRLLPDRAEVVRDVGDGADGPAERLRPRTGVGLDGLAQLLVAGTEFLAQRRPARLIHGADGPALLP